ncbi:MAG: hypothetical protein ACI9LM_003983 [Alteromonadaceae bacterium]|jgi:hypothetical protein
MNKIGIAISLIIGVSTSTFADENENKKLLKALNEHHNVKVLNEKFDTESSSHYSLKMTSINDMPVFLKDIASKQISQMNKNGYYEAEDTSAVSYLDNALKRTEITLLEDGTLSKQSNLVKLDENMLKSISFTPSGFEKKLRYMKLRGDKYNSLIGKITLLSVTPSGGKTQSGWTGLDRLYKIEGLGVVALNEWDHITSKGNMNFIEEAMNEEVNGEPAMFSIAKYRNKYLSELAWSTNTRSYTLSYNGSAQEKNIKNALLELAELITD